MTGHRHGFSPWEREPRPTRPRDERGSAGALLITGATLALAGVFLVACVLIGWFASLRHAESAAELAALAGATAAVSGDDPCSAAEKTALQNRADVAECVVLGSGRNVVVQILVIAELNPQLWGGPETVRRFASAGT